MNETVNEFKKQQNRVLETLKKVNNFLIMGDKIGIDIDDNIKSKILHAINTTEIGKLKVALIGGFSEGKTSIAAAWMEKMDKSSMKITNQESSNEVKVYQVDNDIELIDTPGLFGFKEKYNTDSESIERYKDITQKYISEAHLVLYVMDSANPIKESHNKDLKWLFRTLNLLPRTIFVLSKFDGIADLEDDMSYQEELKIKQKNIIQRLKNEINLKDKESHEISIVAVSANPFDEGTEYWLSNIEEFKKLSHIESLQSATSKKVKNNGGVANILNETKKTIIQDILVKKLPVSKKINENIIQEIDKLSELSENLKQDIKDLLGTITKTKVDLKEFILEHIKDLIMQLDGTSIETIGDFIEAEIGSEGIILNTKIQNEFSKQVETVSLNLEKVEMDFNADVNILNRNIKSFGKQGINYLSKSGLINNNTITITRDNIVKGLKIFGKDLSKMLKFKPYGAINLAKGINVTLAFVGVALEAWDSYDKHKKEEEFQSSKKKMKENFEKQRKDIIHMIDEDNFVNDFFPKYIELVSQDKDIDNNVLKMREMQKNFKEWERIGEIIDVEFS